MTFLPAGSEQIDEHEAVLQTLKDGLTEPHIANQRSANASEPSAHTGDLASRYQSDVPGFAVPGELMKQGRQPRLF